MVVIRPVITGLLAVAALVAAKELLAQVPRDGAQVHEVAVAAARACVLLVLPARRLPEVRHRRELDVDGAPRVEAALSDDSRDRKWRLIACSSTVPLRLVEQKTCVPLDIHCQEHDCKCMVCGTKVQHAEAGH